MKLSLRSEYALLSLIAIARDSKSGASVYEIAGSLQIPFETLHELLGVLLDAKYVRRFKGKLRLAKPMNQISSNTFSFFC